MSGPRVSICLPTWNGARDLERLLPALAAQTITGGFEIVALDSSSSDESVALLEAAGARVEVLSQGDFRHGPARNRLASMARGEVCVFLSQDALPADHGALARLVEPLAHERVAGATARILPGPDEDPLTARTVSMAPEGRAARREKRLAEGTSLAALPDSEREELVRFNDVASAIRRDLLVGALPFPDVPFGEDSAWAASALEAGWTVVFEAGAVVYHAHRYGPRAAFERYPHRRCLPARGPRSSRATRLVGRPARLRLRGPGGRAFRRPET